MRIWVGAGFGLALMALSALVPFLVPRRDQTEVMVITVFLGLTGAMLVYSAQAGGLPQGFPARLRPAARITGTILLFVGLGLPLVQPSSSADVRFLWWVAFGPIALSGAALLWSSLPDTWKERLSASDEDRAPAPGKRRTPVARLNPESAARQWLPLVFIGIIAILSIAMAIALLATILSAGLQL